MSFHPAHLEYFKNLLEGKAEVSWNAWFELHQSELREVLSRSAYLSLKFNKLDEVERVLQDNRVRYRKDPVAFRREKHYSDLGPDALDERGRPREAFRRKAYDGAFGSLMDGDEELARKQLDGFVKKLRRFPIEQRQQELEGLCFDGEMELQSADPVIGRRLLEAAASFPLGNDLTDFAVNRASTLLRQWEQESQRSESFPVALRLKHDQTPQSILLGPDHLIAVSCRDGIFLWNIRSGEPTQTIRDFDPGAHQAVSVWDLSVDGNYLCTGTADLTTKVYQTGSGERLQRLSKLRPDYYNSAAQIRFSPDGRLVATAKGKLIELFSVETWQKSAELKGHTSKVHLLAMVPQTSILVSAAGRYVKFWDLDKAAERHTLPVFKRMLGGLAVSQDSQMLATTTEGGQVDLWRLPDGKHLRGYSDHHSEVFGVAISPDKAMIASSELNGQLHLWRAVDGQCVKRLTPGCGTPLFSPDGTLLTIVADRQTWVIRTADGNVVGDLGESFFLQFLDPRRLVCGDGNDVVVRRIAVDEKDLSVSVSGAVPSRVDRTDISDAGAKKQPKKKAAKTDASRAKKTRRGVSSQDSSRSHFWLNVRRELKTLRLFHSKPDRKTVRPEFADLACGECNKVDELAALKRGLASGVKTPPTNVQLAMTDDGILLVSPKVRQVFSDVAGPALQYFPFPGSEVSIVWPNDILRLPNDAPLRTGSKQQTTVLALASSRCRTCNRPRHVTVRPGRGKYHEDQRIVGLSLEPGFWFVAHRMVGDALKAAKVTGWLREELDRSNHF